MRRRSVRYSACADRASILSAEAFALRPTSAVSDEEGMQVKGSQKPKKLGKKPAQKTLKERRTEKRAAAKHASRGLDVRPRGLARTGIESREPEIQGAVASE